MCQWGLRTQRSFILWPEYLSVVEEVGEEKEKKSSEIGGIEENERETKEGEGRGVEKGRNFDKDESKICLWL